MRVLFGLVLILPLLGALHIGPAPTADLYTPAGWNFMSALMQTGYMIYVLGLISFICLVLVIMNRTALAAVLIAPITVNIVLFHAFLDPTPALALIPAAILLVTNVYFLWLNWGRYKALWTKA